MRVNQQPNIDIATLVRRLRIDFEYNRPVRSLLLMTLIGRAVSIRRSNLLAMIGARLPCPSRLDAAIWHRLEMTKACPSHEERSNQARYANSCRVNLGRTCSKGTHGVIEGLRARLRRSPDPEEIESELRQDKCYGGRKKKEGVVGEDGHECFGHSIRAQEVDAVDTCTFSHDTTPSSADSTIYNQKWKVERSWLY